MLINLKDILELAEEKNYAIAAFNTPTFENLIAALNVAEDRNVPVIVQHAQVHEEVMPLRNIGPVMVELAKKAKVPVCVHLDHGEDIQHIENALKLGFTSVMYDGSILSIEENIENTKKVVSLANKYQAGVEAELGMMSGSELGDIEDGDVSLYTDPELAEQFVKETNITALAASFGTVHGLYRKKPELDIERIKKIRELTGLPVVMHGGSGLSIEDYVATINAGVRKINYYSYASMAAFDAAKSFVSMHEKGLYHDIMTESIHAIEENYKQILDVFYNSKSYMKQG